MNTRYRPERDLNEAWLKTVTEWIDTTGEVLFVLRQLYGGRSYALIASTADLMALIDKSPRGTDVIAVRGPQLPLRGVVDEDFISSAQRLVPEPAEYLFVMTGSASTGDPRLDGREDIGHAMMRSDLRGCLGQQVAFGACPDYMAGDQTRMISFAKDGIDGPR